VVGALEEREMEPLNNRTSNNDEGIS